MKYAMSDKSDKLELGDTNEKINKCNKPKELTDFLK